MKLTEYKKLVEEIKKEGCIDASKITGPCLFMFIYYKVIEEIKYEEKKFKLKMIPAEENDINYDNNDFVFTITEKSVRTYYDGVRALEQMYNRFKKSLVSYVDLNDELFRIEFETKSIWD